MVCFFKQIRFGFFFVFSNWSLDCFFFFSSFYFSIVLQKLPVSRVTKLGIVWLRIWEILRNFLVCSAGKSSDMLQCSWPHNTMCDIMSCPAFFLLSLAFVHLALRPAVWHMDFTWFHTHTHTHLSFSPCIWAMDYGCSCGTFPWAEHDVRMLNL